MSTVFDLQGKRLTIVKANRNSLWREEAVEEEWEYVDTVLMKRRKILHCLA